MSHLSHMQINVAPGNQSFYKNLLLAMGWSTIYEDDSRYSAAGKNGESLWFVDAPKTSRNDYDAIGINHLAFGASSQAEVDATAAYLIGNEIELLFDTPRHRPTSPTMKRMPITRSCSPRPTTCSSRWCTQVRSKTDERCTVSKRSFSS